MVKLILGKSGSGKTKYLIDNANEEKARGNGNIVFIDTDDSHIFSLDYAIRLINAKDFGIDCVKTLYGFLAGIVSRDYDIEKIYLDGIYHIVDFNDENSKYLLERLIKLSNDSEVEFLIGLDQNIDTMIDGVEIVEM